jgi:hypothetical protein
MVEHRNKTLRRALTLLLLAAAIGALYHWRGVFHRTRAIDPPVQTTTQPPAPPRPVRMKALPTLTGAIGDRVRSYGPTARPRLLPYFAIADVAYPPATVTLVGLKQENRLQVYASERAGDPPRFIRDYPILAASGGPGPKLREGDGQVPEGIYGIDSLNPFSSYHVALRVNYPNADDRTHAREDGRTHLGGDIMIHGSNCSIGCLAMGDEVSEELFVLAAETGIAHVRILLAPYDFRTGAAPPDLPTQPTWVGGLYEEIKGELGKLPAATSAL